MSDTVNFSRRQFIGGSLATSAAVLAAGAPLAAAQPGGASAPQRKIKLGVIGLGGRGSWLAKLFQSTAVTRSMAWPITFPRWPRAPATPWA